MQLSESWQAGNVGKNCPEYPCIVLLSTYRVSQCTVVHITVTVQQCLKQIIKKQRTETNVSWDLGLPNQPTSNLKSAQKLKEKTTHIHTSGLPPVSRPVTYKGTPSLLPCPQRGPWCISDTAGPAEFCFIVWGLGGSYRIRPYHVLQAQRNAVSEFPGHVSCIFCIRLQYMKSNTTILSWQIFYQNKTNMKPFLLGDSLPNLAVDRDSFSNGEW